MKTCSICRQTKPLDVFCKDRRNKDGRAAHCRACYNANYRSKYEAILKTDAGRKHLRELKANRTISSARREAERRDKKRYATVYPEKQRAKRLVRHSIESGNLVRPTTCSNCGEAPRPRRDGRPSIQAHHSDYSRPLEITWLCPICHTAEHRARKD